MFGIWPLPPEAVGRQIEVVADDIGLDAAKTGMLGSAEMVVSAVASLRRCAPLPLVLDPVMVAKGGERLLHAEAESALREELLPLASLVTPNLPEAEVLTGLPTRSRDECEQVARSLVEMGAKAALVKGGHAPGEVVEDLLFDGKQFFAFRGERLDTVHTHGTGCTLSAAIATGLGQGLSLYEAVERAIRYVQAAIRLAPGLGHGHGPLSHSAGGAPWT